MKMALLSVGVLVALVSVRAPADEPAAKGERWVSVRTFKGSWRVRVDGGPVLQVAAKPEVDKRWKFIPGVGLLNRGVSGFLSPDGKKAIYSEEESDTEKSKGITDWPCQRIVLADSDGKNPKVMLNNVIWYPGFRPCPDGKAVVCGAAEAKDKWYAYRVSFDGSKPVKLSETVGVDAPVIIPLLNDRYLYCPVTIKETMENGPFTTEVTKGPAILIDGKKETVLVKETSRTPEVSQDATMMALDVKNEKGEEVIEITDLKTGKKEEVALKAFNKDWKCRFCQLKFSPDNKALVVMFFLGGVVIRNDGPLPGDEAVEYIGVVWLDGRKDRTSLFHVDLPRDGKTGSKLRIDYIDWSTAPPEKK